MWASQAIFKHSIDQDQLDHLGERERPSQRPVLNRECHHPKSLSEMASNDRPPKIGQCVDQKNAYQKGHPISDSCGEGLSAFSNQFPEIAKCNEVRSAGSYRKCPAGNLIPFRSDYQEGDFKKSEGVAKIVGQWGISPDEGGF